MIKHSSLFCSTLVTISIIFVIFNSIHLSTKKRNKNCEANEGGETESIQHHPLERVNGDFKKLTSQEIMDYFFWSNASSCQLAHDFGGGIMKNPSGFDGQKAVCLDPLVRPPVNDCIVYSFGISNEWSFDQAMENYGCRVYAFDPSMGKGNHKHSRNIQFFNLGLSDRDYTTENGWEMKTLSSIYKMLVPHHGKKIIDYLKMDIESSEWVVLPHLISSGMLAKVRQLGVEIHFANRYDTREEMISRVNVLKSVEDAGMIRFDSKYNMWSIGWIDSLDSYTGPDCFEIAFFQQMPSPTLINPVYKFNRH